ncbi:MAG: phosphoribosylanthranilate isomerase [Deltaproteobacteria bacterium]|nr:phosphoribosylanthranilate isomerase [Deltaproteobacteria bacterium]
MHRFDYRPEIKICGLTRANEAVACAEAGADAIGLVFYPPSPRHLTPQQAREISLALPDQIARVGVFANSPVSDIQKRIGDCRLTAIQLHGQESPDMVRQFCDKGIRVIKALFIHKYPAAAFLVECGKGRLPGGNALTWNWSEVKSFGQSYPLILAGGLSPDTIARAVADAGPDAVDVSSGVEFSPGRKDIKKVRALIQAISLCTIERPPRRIWRLPE